MHSRKVLHDAIGEIRGIDVAGLGHGLFNDGPTLGRDPAARRSKGCDDDPWASSLTMGRSVVGSRWPGAVLELGAHELGKRDSDAMDRQRPGAGFGDQPDVLITRTWFRAALGPTSTSRPRWVTRTL